MDCVDPYSNKLGLENRCSVFTKIAYLGMPFNSIRIKSDSQKECKGYYNTITEQPSYEFYAITSLVK